MENTKEIIRVYSVEEYEKYFNGKKYVSEKELININIIITKGIWRSLLHMLLQLVSKLQNTLISKKINSVYYHMRYFIFSFHINFIIN